MDVGQVRKYSVAVNLQKQVRREGISFRKGGNSIEGR
jgi:hypothetical protein